MDGERFDAIARALASRPTRRRMLGGLLAVLPTVMTTGATRAQGVDACATFCQNLPTGRLRGDCVSAAARGEGLCFECGPAAPAGTDRVLCGTTCVDTSSDPSNCGSCGEECPASESCNSGTCGPACIPVTGSCPDGGCCATGTEVISCEASFTSSDPVCCRPEGEPCVTSAECCASGGACPPDGGVCGGVGAICDFGSQCISELCYQNQCVACIPVTGSCPDGGCCATGTEVISCEASFTSSDPVCCRPEGEPCVTSAECCASGGACPPDGGVCGGVGAICDFGSQCVSNTCESGFCV